MKNKWVFIHEDNASRTFAMIVKNDNIVQTIVRCIDYDETISSSMIVVQGDCFGIERNIPLNCE
jgi:hypothetical protein